MCQAMDSLRDDGILSEPPVDKWSGIKSICGVSEFEPFKGMLDACSEISKVVLKIKGKTAEAGDVTSPVEAARKVVVEIMDAQFG